MKNKKPTSKVRIEIRDPRISEMRDIGDIASYYWKKLPVQVSQDVNAQVVMTYDSKSRAARIQFIHENGECIINYDINLYRSTK